MSAAPCPGAVGTGTRQPEARKASVAQAFDTHLYPGIGIMFPVFYVLARQEGGDGGRPDGGTG